MPLNGAIRSLMIINELLKFLQKNPSILADNTNFGSNNIRERKNNTKRTVMILHMALIISILSIDIKLKNSYNCSTFGSINCKRIIIIP